MSMRLTLVRITLMLAATAAAGSALTDLPMALPLGAGNFKISVWITGSAAFQPPQCDRLREACVWE
jgi:hypothetical protein